MKKVDIIASGYEWTCPKCETINDTIEVPNSDEILICRECKEKYRVGDVAHAYS